MSRRASRAFTLTELIMVIFIVSIIMGTGIVAFTSINKGANVRNALLQVKMGTILARERAVINRQRVVFCIPTVYYAAGQNYVRKNMQGCSFVLFSEVTGGVAVPSSILGKIEQLPDGVVFTNSYNNAEWSDFECQSTNGTVLFAGRGFRYAPTGTIYYKDQEKCISGSFKLVVMEGDVDENGTKTYRRNPIVSTASVYTVSGRCVLP